MIKFSPFKLVKLNVGLRSGMLAAVADAHLTTFPFKKETEATNATCIIPRSEGELRFFSERDISSKM